MSLDEEIDSSPSSDDSLSGIDFWDGRRSPRPPEALGDYSQAKIGHNFVLGTSIFQWFILSYGYNLNPECLGRLPKDVILTKWALDEHSEYTEELLEQLDSLISYGDRGWFDWGHENNVSPGQPFLVRFGPPESYQSSYEYNEWDMEYDVELVKVVPKSVESSQRSWAKAEDRYNRDCLKDERHRAHLEKVALARKSKWVLKTSWSDNMSHVCFSLYSESRDLATIGTKVKERDLNPAFLQLVKLFVERFPNEDFSRLLELGAEKGLYLPSLERLLLNSGV